jgi:hypothetical protein
MKESGGEFTVNGKSLARFDFWINFCYEYVTSDVAMEIFHSVLRDFSPSPYVAYRSSFV